MNNIKIKVIETEVELQNYLDWLEKQFDRGVKPNSKMGKKVEAVINMICQYEDINYPIL